MKIPLFVNLNKPEFYTNSLFNTDDCFRIIEPEKLVTNDIFKWLTHILIINQQRNNEILNERDKKILYNYLKNVFKEKTESSFYLIFDGYDEFPFKNYSGNITPRHFFGYKINRAHGINWKGAVVLSSRPYILNDLEIMLDEKLNFFDNLGFDVPNDYNEKGFFYKFYFMELKEFTDDEIKTYVKNQPIYKNNNDFKNWFDFKKTIINYWNEYFGNDWKIPLFLHVLSSKENIREMPNTKIDLYLEIFKYSFNWFYSKKDYFKENFEWLDYNEAKQLKKISFNYEMKQETTFNFEPILLYKWELELIKKLAYYMSKKNSYRFTINEYQDLLLTHNIFPDIDKDMHSKFNNIFKQTINDGNFIISPMFDGDTKYFYFSPWRLQEIFTAIKFNEERFNSSKIETIKQLLRNIKVYRDTIKLCWELSFEKNKKHQKVKDILIKSCEDYRFLFDLTLKRSISNRNNEYIYNIMPSEILSDVKQLDIIEDNLRITQLMLISLPISNVDLLGNLSKLKILYLPDTQLDDINFLRKLTELQTLILFKNRISNIDSIQFLKKLSDLSLGENLITDISPLRNLINIQKLYLYNNKINDITILENLTNLQELGLDNNTIRNISSLGNLQYLKILSLENCQISDISSLNNLPELCELTLRSNKIKNIESIQNLKIIKSLNLSKNRIENINAIKNLANIQYLYLDDNQIVDINPLINLGNLKELDLSNNQIVNFEVLKHLKELQVLNIHGNPINTFDISYIVFHENLMDFKIDNNVNLICKREFYGNFTSPALLRLLGKISTY